MYRVMYPSSVPVNNTEAQSVPVAIATFFSVMGWSVHITTFTIYFASYSLPHSMAYSGAYYYSIKAYVKINENSALGTTRNSDHTNSYKLKHTGRYVRFPDTI